MESGKLVSDELVIGIIGEAIVRPECRRALWSRSSDPIHLWLLELTPRLLEQVSAVLTMSSTLQNWLHPRRLPEDRRPGAEARRDAREARRRHPEGTAAFSPTRRPHPRERVHKRSPRCRRSARAVNGLRTPPAHR